jgi:hypothetical protein
MLHTLKFLSILRTTNTTIQLSASLIGKSSFEAIDAIRVTNFWFKSHESKKKKKKNLDLKRRWGTSVGGGVPTAFTLSHVTRSDDAPETLVSRDRPAEFSIWHRTGCLRCSILLFSLYTHVFGARTVICWLKQHSCTFHRCSRAN